MNGRLVARGKNPRERLVNGLVILVWSVDSGPSDTDLERAFGALARTGCVVSHVALMPDHHPAEAGMVGSVVPTADTLLPGALGGDIGCGMCAVPLPLGAGRLARVLVPLSAAIEAAVPVGRAWNRTVTPRVLAAPVFAEEAPLATRAVRATLARELGSLGGGNHFLELRADEEDRLWILVHSGSRAFGQLVRDHHVRVAGAGRARGLPVLAAGSAEGAAFLADHDFAVAFARASRREMALRVVEAVRAALGDTASGLADADEVLAGAIDVPHDLVTREDHLGRSLFVHRKGAARAGEGEAGVIPGSMGSPAFLVEGKGAPLAFCSSSHGAGRALTRTEARRVVSGTAVRRSMEGIVYDERLRLADEAPAAYRDIGRVMRAQHDLVRVRHTLRPLLVVKGG